jgi:hypothetical protein
METGVGQNEADRQTPERLHFFVQKSKLSVKEFRNINLSSNQVLSD